MPRPSLTFSAPSSKTPLASIESFGTTSIIAGCFSCWDAQLKCATVKKIELAVQLAFKLKGFVLKIQNGRILEMQTGHCEAKGTIKYGTLLIAEKKLEPIKLPLTIPIPASIGFPIANPVSPVVTTASDKAAPPVERIEI